MEKILRTFIAIKIIPDHNFIQLISLLKTKLKDHKIKWVDENNFHLTFRFLGNTTSDQIENIKSKLENITGKYKSFPLNLKGLGYFESKGKPRVLFVKTEKSQTLEMLAEEIKNHIIPFGFKEGNLEFKPHLTLGRIKFMKDKNSLISMLQNFEDTEIQKIYVSEIIFYQSILSSTGPVYKPIKIFKLNYYDCKNTTSTILCCNFYFYLSKNK